MMKQRLLFVGCAALVTAIWTASDVQTQQGPAAAGAPVQGAPAGRGPRVGGPPLSQLKWEPWNSPGLRMTPPDFSPDGPAPRRDLSGLWDTARAGIGARGLANPAPLTPWGEMVSREHHSGDGIRQVEATEINDPLSTLGDPGGYPRNLFFELRQVQFLPTPASVVRLFMWERRWQVIWTDGRQLPQEPDPRWYGYLIGRWEDDYTFVITANGTDERTWLDNAGNPHSDQLVVEERWRRVTEKTMELTVTLTDPKAYTRPWVAIDKMRLIQIPSNVDLMEMMNSATEAKAVADQYKKEAALPTR